VSPENVTDEDWSTYGYSSSRWSYLYLNYSKPNDYLNSSLWQIKNEEGTENISITNACWSQTPLQLRVGSTSTGQTAVYCWDGSWDLLDFTTTGAGMERFYEEAMWWNLSGYSGFINDSFVAITGTTNWSNVTKVITSSVGVDVAWRVYANDSTNQWNSSLIYSYTTTSAPDTCTPPAINNNWNIDCSDNCIKEDDVLDLGTGNITVYGGSGVTWFKNYNLTINRITINATLCDVKTTTFITQTFG
jgi:hypothetical protein